MTRTLTSGSEQRRLADRCLSTRTPEPPTVDTVTVTAGTAGTSVERFLTVGEAATFLRLSESWLAKARMRGDGPRYVKIGRAIRYSESALLHWTRSNTRLSTSDRS